ncbi:MAG: sigma-70 family RNA polymerase sigma factor [Clostridia bacterium]|nr:sigma-70 family RNA polymerase sigma factor [Clostridia bacterium]
MIGTDIVARAQKGDHDAFEQIVTAFEKKVYNMALRYTNDPEDALDISQEVFLRVYRFLPNYKGNSTLSTWIYRITMNVCHDTAGKKSNLNELSLDAGDDDEKPITEISDVRFDPEKEFERKQTKELIARGIALLDSEQRDAIIMRDINGMSYDEIADVLGLSQGTVKSRIFRAREKLKNFLIKNGNFFEEMQSNYNEEPRKEDRRR